MNSFNFLGSSMSEDRECRAGVKSRIGKCQVFFSNFKMVWRNSLRSKSYES